MRVGGRERAVSAPVKYSGQLTGTVKEVRDSMTVVEVPDAPEAHLRRHELINGSPNQCPANLRRVGQRVTLEWRSAVSYGLWFVAGPA